MLWLVVLCVLGARAEEDWLEAARAVLEEAVRGQDGGLLAALGASHSPGSPDPLQGLMSAMASGQAAGGLAGLLPALLSQGHEHHEDPALEDEAAHSRHDELTDLLLSYLGSLWDRLKQTDLARELWTDSGLHRFLHTWASEAGQFTPHRLLDALGNPSFRRTWVHPLTSSIAHWIYHLNNPDTQQRYLNNAAMTINQLLKSQGFSDKELIKPGVSLDDSLTRVVDTLMMKQLGLQVSSAVYVKPAVAYFTDVLKVGRGTVSGLTSKEIEERLSDTLNIEVIDSILRVYRGYKYSLEKHSCDKQILCHLNRPADPLETLRPGVTKLSSLVSAWFLSGHTGTPFLNLYGALTAEQTNCQKLYPADCTSWHEEDFRLTTDYTHNEL